MYNNPQAKDYVEALLTRAARPMCALFQITGHNRARQRDKWAHMLDDLSNLQEEVGVDLLSCEKKSTCVAKHEVCLCVCVCEVRLDFVSSEK